MAGLLLCKRPYLLLFVIASILTILALAVIPFAHAQQIHRNPFESIKPSWTKGRADVAYTVKEHLRTDKIFHEGQRSELIHIEAKQGSYIHYEYPIGRAPIAPELNIGVWVKANRQNIELLARVVLPNARDPKSLNDSLVTIIRGDKYKWSGRWQQLRLNQPILLAQRQKQMMQAQLKRPIDFTDAYVDKLILNVYGGPGETIVWIDDLETGPIAKHVPNAVANIQEKPGISRPIGSPNRPERQPALVEFNGSHLMVGGKRFFIRGIRYSNTPLNVLRTAGFNTLWVSHTTSPKKLQEAADQGFWLVPNLQIAQDNYHLVSKNILGQTVSQFPALDRVLFWDFGGALATEQTAKVTRAVQMVRAADPQRPAGGDVWDGFQPYSRQLNLMGVHRWPLMTDLELTSYHQWLEQRQRLANPGTFTWTWIQTHTPEFFTRLLYNQESDKNFDVPVGPQPAQVRLMTYTAVGAGCKGLGFWSDRFLADSHQGRDRLLSLALINKELEMIEPLLVTAKGSPNWIKSSVEDVPAAVFRTAKGILVIPMWLGNGAQFVPGQSAVSRLSIVVPQVPPGTQAWEVTPGEVRSLRSKRVVGGTEVTIPDFGLTTCIVFTPDTNLIVRFQEHARAIRQLAAQWTYDQATSEIKKVIQVQQQLQQQGQGIPQAAQLLNQANERLQTAKVLWDQRLFGESYRESQRALRPVRILMRAQWDRAVASLDSPVAIPYGVSYYTLPKFWEMAGQISSGRPGANVLDDGDFESQQQGSWELLQVPTLDEVQLAALRVGKETGNVEPKSGKLCAVLQVNPKQAGSQIGALERTYVAINSKKAKLAPGTLVRISAWVHIPEPIQASVDGALFFETSGGEPLAIRMTEETAWKKLMIYRRVPASGEIGVSLALSGIGRVYFDDVRIEPFSASTQN